MSIQNLKISLKMMLAFGLVMVLMMKVLMLLSEQCGGCYHRISIPPDHSALLFILTILY